MSFFKRIFNNVGEFYFLTKCDKKYNHWRELMSNNDIKGLERFLSKLKPQELLTKLLRHSEDVEQYRGRYHNATLPYLQAHSSEAIRLLHNFGCPLHTVSCHEVIIGRNMIVNSNIEGFQELLNCGLSVNCSPKKLLLNKKINDIDNVYEENSYFENAIDVYIPLQKRGKMNVEKLKKLIQIMIDAGLDINKKIISSGGTNQYTPLGILTYYKQEADDILPVLELLLSAKADINQSFSANGQIFTPITQIAYYSNLVMFDYLTNYYSSDLKQITLFQEQLIQYAKGPAAKFFTDRITAYIIKSERDSFEALIPLQPFAGEGLNSINPIPAVEPSLSTASISSNITGIVANNTPNQHKKVKSLNKI